MCGCAAPYCNNSAAKGYTMKDFLEISPEQQAIWRKNINREDCYQQTIHFFLS